MPTFFFFTKDKADYKQKQSHSSLSAAGPVQDYKCHPVILAVRTQAHGGLATAEETLDASCCGGDLQGNESLMSQLNKQKDKASYMTGCWS